MAKDYNETIQILWRTLNECIIDPSLISYIFLLWIKAHWNLSQNSDCWHFSGYVEQLHTHKTEEVETNMETYLQHANNNLVQETESYKTSRTCQICPKNFLLWSCHLICISYGIPIHTVKWLLPLNASVAIFKLS